MYQHIFLARVTGKVSSLYSGKLIKEFSALELPTKQHTRVFQRILPTSYNRQQYLGIMNGYQYAKIQAGLATLTGKEIKEIDCIMKGHSLSLLKYQK